MISHMANMTVTADAAGTAQKIPGIFPPYNNILFILKKPEIS